jgi:tRNA U34 5-methylaminomethyl-2-thiouridine-forming methyltransferase MnmC
MKYSGYKIIVTEDGSFSLYSEDYCQAMHSASGAYREALLKHIYPSRILDKINKDLFILDIGFGIGYNALALLYEFTRKKKVKNFI